MRHASFLRRIKKYLQGRASSQEKDLLDQWMESLENKNEVQDSWNPEEKKKRFQHILNRIDQQEEAGKVVPLFSIRRGWSVAAALLLLAVVTMVLWHYTNSDATSEIEQITSTSGQPGKVILSDGTIVWLKGNSTLSYPAQFDHDTRNVSLHGQALFEVAKDPAHPFVITCNDMTATVLGTSFHITTSPGQTEVNVLTGKVLLSSSQHSITVIPNETGIYANDQLIKKTSEPLHEKSLLAGTQYDMRFDDVTAGEVMDRLEEKFEVAIELKNSAIRRCRITADFTDQSLPNTLQVMGEVLNLQYEIQNELVVINGEGCQ